MKNVLKTSGLLYTIALLLFLSTTAAVYSAPGAMPTPCSSPTVSITGQTPGSISFDWNDVSGAIGYKVWYVRTDNNTNSQQYTTGDSHYDFPSLTSGTYNFYFATICEAGISEVFIIVDVMM